MASSPSQAGDATAGAPQLLVATYHSPANAPFSYTKELASPPTPATADRVAYLEALRKATAELQMQINSELTQRMEEDKASHAASIGDKANDSGIVDEGKEEDNYGEEVAEDED